MEETEQKNDKNDIREMSEQIQLLTDTINNIENKCNDFAIGQKKF